MCAPAPLAGPRLSRSSLIEQILLRYLAEQARSKINSRELKLLNQSADRLSAEAEAVRGYMQNCYAATDRYAAFASRFSNNRHHPEVKRSKLHEKNPAVRNSGNP